jgi:hypothetical protein
MSIKDYRLKTSLINVHYSKVCAFLKLKYICSPFGGLAQLARALPWHGRGHRFDSDILHQPPVCFVQTFLFYLVLSTGKIPTFNNSVCLTTDISIIVNISFLVSSLKS